MQYSGRSPYENVFVLGIHFRDLSEYANIEEEGPEKLECSVCHAEPLSVLVVIKYAWICLCFDVSKAFRLPRVPVPVPDALSNYTSCSTQETCFRRTGCCRGSCSRQHRLARRSPAATPQRIRHPTADKKARRRIGVADRLPSEVDFSSGFRFCPKPRKWLPTLPLLLVINKQWS